MVSAGRKASDYMSHKGELSSFGPYLIKSELLGPACGMLPKFCFLRPPEDRDKLSQSQHTD